MALSKTLAQSDLTVGPSAGATHQRSLCVVGGGEEGVTGEGVDGVRRKGGRVVDIDIAY